MSRPPLLDRREALVLVEPELKVGIAEADNANVAHVDDGERSAGGVNDDAPVAGLW